MASKLDQLRQLSTVVADTGDLDAIERFKPEDATTNPSLLLKAAQLPLYRPLVDELLGRFKPAKGHNADSIREVALQLAVSVGREITQLVPGKVSTEVDARLSFNREATAAQARRLIELYESQQVDRSRILIKIASTWEGIAAAETLEKEGIECNLTLLFSFAQAKACADAGATLISPFVGRILDWHKARGEQFEDPMSDPGVRSVTRIYNYYKTHDYDTVVMGASFRNTGEILSLAGCDRLTISPALLAELEAEQGEVERILLADGAASDDPKQTLDESHFRWQLNDDAMATEKLAEGIRGFAADQEKLEQLLYSWSNN